jgi:hypothetical protein
MRPNQLLFLTALFFFTTSYSQEIRISKSLPESENTFIGTWGSKVLSYKVLELFIVDTASAVPVREVVKIGPQIEKADKTGSVHYFIHDHFLYEVYFVIPKLNEVYRSSSYNILVKRDLETMKIVTQKKLDHFHSQMKFVKCFDDGFFFCFGGSYSIFTGAYNIFFESPPREVIPSIVHTFNYDLEEIWSMDVNGFLSYSELMNDISFDDEYLVIPTIRKGQDDERTLNLVIADLKGKIADVKLKFELEQISGIYSVKVKYDEPARVFRAVLLVDLGYISLTWDEKGNLLDSYRHRFKVEELYNSYTGEALLKTSDFGFSFFAYQKNQTDILYFDILANGDAICVANNVCRDSKIKSVRNSKFAWRISKDGNLKWSAFFPYDEDLLYYHSFCLMQDGALHLYTREKAKLFNKGTDSPKGESDYLMADRVIDIQTGDVISHKSILNQPIGNYTPEGVTKSFAQNEYIIRYRKSSKNMEKLVFMSF